MGVSCQKLVDVGLKRQGRTWGEKESDEVLARMPDVEAFIMADAPRIDT
jgi:hypothetical protein